MARFLKYCWRLWAKALGQKEGSTDAEADAVAAVRTALVLLGLFLNIIALVTNLVIMAGVHRHWDDTKKGTTHERHCTDSVINDGLRR